METRAEISVVLNGERRAVPAGTGLSELVASLGLPAQGVLIEHNGRALLRDEIPGAILRQDDRVEILRVVAGG